ncbi:hypothetical protein [Methanococcus voltae]|uniref:Uncharacterized protein n=1 Tax=Methanococcus voltae (strain ATCC BAA-1334 / A3) TaxID=456320 RepID=D7DSC6_METV3|nr:hypothetical protein [Methanococcus voltae]MCS3901562.1 RsiW-degrading membrane proteinase PrsW (M82 family) [Methanococcus voltae]
MKDERIKLLKKYSEDLEKSYYIQLDEHNHLKNHTTNILTIYVIFATLLGVFQNCFKSINPICTSISLALILSALMVLYEIFNHGKPLAIFGGENKPIFEDSESIEDYYLVVIEYYDFLESKMITSNRKLNKLIRLEYVVIFLILALVIDTLCGNYIYNAIYSNYITIVLILILIWGMLKILLKIMDRRGDEL